MDKDAFEREYDKLNQAQKEAVDSIEGPVLVIAGPGSGKTQILSLRVANILLRTDIRPGNVLCLTFTDSAAVNMRKRLSGMIGPDAYRVSIYTFHGFGADLIERFSEYFYQGARFSPADELTQIEVLEEILGALPHDNPLVKIHPEQGYTYLYDIRQAIGQLKKAGLRPEEFEAILGHNERSILSVQKSLVPVFETRLSLKELGRIEDALRMVTKEKARDFPVTMFKPYAPTIGDSLERALSQAVEKGKTEPLSEWKADHFAKDGDGKRVLKDFLQLPKLRALAGIYRAYRDRMYELGFFDFDDMLIETIEAIEKNPELKYELWEQYQYVLVDEFQDTNDAQMRLLELLLSADVNEGRPNVMAVGDDDQAIYKFQGAELSNILNFKGAYTDPKIITLTHNYRSTQTILDLARFVIGRGKERLETRMPEIEKKLTASNKGLAKGEVRGRSFGSEAAEYHFVAKELKRLIAEGEDPKEIAVIARKHANLRALVPYLNAEGVPFAYERQQDVLKEPHIRELIMLTRFVSSLMRKDKEAADHLLPEILSYPFWKISRADLWGISVEADREQKLWLEVMLRHKSGTVRNVAEFLIGLGQMAHHETIEKLLDTMIGSHVSLAAESADEDEEEKALPSIDSFVSPFKEYYWSREKLNDNRAEYLIFLSGLRTFIGAVREYKRGKPLKADDLVQFADIHEKNEIAIPDTSPFVNGLHAVSLVTAHKAKGLEWKTVFVINCVQNVWAGRGMGTKLPFPENLPIAPAGDTTDDQLRLFYVALTRAKSNLYLTSSEILEGGKEATMLQFLLPHSAEGEHNPEVLKLLDFAVESGEEGDMLGRSVEALQSGLAPSGLRPIVHDEEAILRPLVEDYKLSITHLNNFLNVGRGGPVLFLEQNLIRFPQAKTLANVYGTAMHGAVERIYSYLRNEGKFPPFEQVEKWLSFELRRERMTDGNFTGLYDRGRKALGGFLKEKRESFDPDHRIEVNFANQGVTVHGAHLTGKIDKMVQVSAGEYSVHDFKTGKAIQKWEGKDQFEKIKLHQYKYQLIFYKLLVENSREFCERCVVRRGCLEFLEPLNGKIVELSLEMEDDDVERVSKLAEAVYKKITALEFPDVSGYSDDLAGIIAFENDLLEGKI